MSTVSTVSADTAPSLTSVASLMTRQIHFVSGKGGVGKSAVACALATHLARDGKKVLLAQVNAQDSHQRLLGLGEPVPNALRDVGGGLVVVNIEPDSAMKEYALMTLKFESVYKMAFENRLTRAFLRFVPSLSELTLLGKLWFHAEEKAGDGPRFDHMVVDLPSTGHGLGLLRVARVVREVTGVGPMAEKTREMEETFKDPNRACLHIVTLPEELPANEMMELLAEARTEAVVPVGMCIVNQVNHPIFDAAQRNWAHAAAPTLRDDVKNEPTGEDDKGLLDALLHVARRRMVREELEKKTLERLSEQALKAPRVLLPFLTSETFERAEIARLRTLLARAESATISTATASANGVTKKEESQQ